MSKWEPKYKEDPIQRVKFLSVSRYWSTIHISMLVCSLLPWPYLWTQFGTKVTYGRPMTQGWPEKYKNFKFSNKNFWNFLKFFFWMRNIPHKIPFCPNQKFPPRMPLPSLNFSFSPYQKFISLNASSNPKGKKGAVQSVPEAT